VDPAIAPSTAARESNGPIASRLTPNTDVASAPTATLRCRRQAWTIRRIQPEEGASGTLTP
jgi:hypothetical protein